MKTTKGNTSWTEHVYGLGLTQRGNTYQHWNWRGGFDGDGGQQRQHDPCAGE
jgi:hypothetical protein